MTWLHQKSLDTTRNEWSLRMPYACWSLCWTRSRLSKWNVFTFWPPQWIMKWAHKLPQYSNGNSSTQLRQHLIHLFTHFHPKSHFTPFTTLHLICLSWMYRNLKKSVVCQGDCFDSIKRFMIFVYCSAILSTTRVATDAYSIFMAVNYADAFFSPITKLIVAKISASQLKLWASISLISQ